MSLSPDEVRTGNTSTLSNLLVERGAAVVYDEGMGSFDQTGHQDTGLFSAQGIVKRISQRLTAGAHETANRATVVMLGITAVLAVAVVLTYRERRRLRALGIGVLLGGTAGALACVFLGFLADRAGGHDPFTSDVRSIVENVLDVAKRNFAIVGILGVVITGASMLITTARLEEADGYANEDEDEDDLDYGDDDSYDEPHEAEEFDDDDRRDDPGE